MKNKSIFTTSRHFKLIVLLIFVSMLALSALTVTSCAPLEEGNPIIDSFLKCHDNDYDHLCDVCEGVMSDCIDEDLDHICDLCGKETVKCPVDKDWNHTCDVCGVIIIECFDNNNDHICDYCKIAVLGCEDQNSDHNCDVCKLKLTSCEDSDKNHLCDICGKRLSECKEGRIPDHVCEYCGNTFTECYDNDKNHSCDICYATLSVCEDVIKDHMCDVCGDVLSHCIDETNNFVCEICGALIPWLKVKMADGCLINGLSEETIFQVRNEYMAVFSYAADTERVVTGWIIYDMGFNEVDRIEGTSFYSFSESGYYQVSPIFENN